MIVELYHDWCKRVVKADAVPSLATRFQNAARIYPPAFENRKVWSKTYFGLGARILAGAHPLKSQSKYLVSHVQRNVTV